jgi:hypothetical protein
MALYGIGDVAALRQALAELATLGEAFPRAISPGAVRLLTARACRRLAGLAEEEARGAASCAGQHGSPSVIRAWGAPRTRSAWCSWPPP